MTVKVANKPQIELNTVPFRPCTPRGVPTLDRLRNTRLKLNARRE